MNTSLAEEDSDHTLLQEIAQGSQKSFNLLYTRYQHSLFHYLIGFFFDQTLAEDTAAEFWTTVWTHAHTFRGEASVKSWLFKVARNKALDELRRVKTQTQQTSDKDSQQIIEEVPGEADLPDDAYRKRQLQNLIRIAMTRLSAEHREVLELLYYQGFTYYEIAEIVDIPLNTVKSRFRLAKEHLKRILEHSGYDQGLTA